MKYKNSSGTAFVFGSYRKKITVKAPAQIRESVKRDIVSHGPYVSIIGRNEAVFNSEQGISSGDFVLRQLDLSAYPNAVYCEQLNDSMIAVVVISGGKVITDCLCGENENSADIAHALDANPVSYRLILAGGISKKDLPWSTFQVIDKKTIELEDCLFEGEVGDVNQNEHVVLSTLDIAFEKAGLVKNTSILFPVIFIVLTCLVVYFLIPEKEVSSQSMVVDPFQDYRASNLTGISAVSVVLKSITLIRTVETLPGWRLQSIDMNTSNFKATILNMGGTTASFRNIEAVYPDVKFRLENGTNSLNGSISATTRNFPYVIYKLPEVEAHLFNELSAKQQYSVTVISEVDKGSYVNRQYSISAKNITFVEIEIIANVMKFMPISIDQLSIKPVDTGYDVTINLSIFGSRG